MIGALALRLRMLVAGGGTHAERMATSDGRARERMRRAMLATGSSLGAKVISISTSLISVPLTLHYLGTELYGIWMVLTSFNMMLAFADLGIGNGILNEVARAFGRDDRVQIRRVVSSGYALLLGIGALLAAGFLVAAPFVPWARLFNVVTPEARAAILPAVAVFVLCFAAGLPASVTQKVQVGLQQGFNNGLWQAAGNLLGLAGVLAAIAVHGGLWLLVLGLVGGPLLGNLLNTIVFFARTRDLRPAPRFVNRAALAATSHTGGMFFMVQIVVAIAYGLDTMIIAQVAGAAAVAQYAVPDRLFALITTVVTMALTPLWPAYGEAIARGDGPWVKRTFYRTLRVAALFSTAMSLVLILGGQTIIHYWVGDVVRPSLLLLLGLGVWRVVEACGNCLAFYMNGANLMKMQAGIGFVSAFIKLGVKIMLVKSIGVAGIPWGNSVAFVLTSGLPFLFLIRRHLARMTPEHTA